jgi:hypothetical protein
MRRRASCSSRWPATICSSDSPASRSLARSMRRDWASSNRSPYCAAASAERVTSASAPSKADLQAYQPDTPRARLGTNVASARSRRVRRRCPPTDLLRPMLKAFLTERSLTHVPLYPRAVLPNLSSGSNQPVGEADGRGSRLAEWHHAGASVRFTARQERRVELAITPATIPRISPRSRRPCLPSAQMSGSVAARAATASAESGLWVSARPQAE